MANLLLLIPSPASASKLWSNAILARLCLGGCPSDRLHQGTPRYLSVSVLRLEYQPVMKWGVEWVWNHPKAAKIYSCPRLLLSSKWQIISLFISNNVMVGEIWKGQQGGIRAGNTAEDYIFSASPAPLFSTVLADLWLVFFLSNPLLCYPVES